MPTGITFKITITGLEEAIARLNTSSGSLEPTVQKGMKKGADQIMKDAQSTVHVITGKLKSSGRVQTGGKDSVGGGFSMPYASIEEMRTGGSRGGKHAYLGPAIEKNKDKIVKFITDEIANAIK